MLTHCPERGQKAEGVNVDPLQKWGEKMKYNEVRIRNVDAAAIKKIDELAKQKNMSRNTFLKAYIESLSVMGELKEMDIRYTLLVENVAGIIERNTLLMEELRYLIDSKGV
jgi:hypothetical protein